MSYVKSYVRVTTPSLCLFFFPIFDSDSFISQFLNLQSFIMSIYYNLDAQYYFQLQRIPDNFLRKHGDQLSTVATLNVPDGSVWRLGLKKVDNRVCFVDGWQDFIQRYSIDIGYLLVFTYEGRSNFIVYIFRTVELDYQSTIRSRVGGPFHEICHHIFEGIEDVDSFDFLDSAPSNPTGALQGKDSTGCMDQLIPAVNHIQQRQENKDTKKTSRKKRKSDLSKLF